mgnify:CR=1 FL=1|tara:strand:- start:443 stop:703 length:261 start_codon:yes stop_codon:yes gene_type:complete
MAPKRYILVTRYTLLQAFRIHLQRTGLTPGNPFWDEEVLADEFLAFCKKPTMNDDEMVIMPSRYPDMDWAQRVARRMIREQGSPIA